MPRRASQPVRLAPSFHVANTFWLVFFVTGAPTDYWLETPVWFRILFADVAPALALAFLGHGLVRSVRASPLASAAWTAFVFSVPYLIYDALYFRGYAGEGWDYLATWWHLPVFSALPWLAVPYWVRRARTPGFSTPPGSPAEEGA